MSKYIIVELSAYIKNHELRGKETDHIVLPMVLGKAVYEYFKQREKEKTNNMR